MFGNRFKTVVWLAVTLVLVLPGFGNADYDYIDINDPSMKKVPIAIPLFKSISSNFTEKNYSKKA